MAGNSAFYVVIKMVYWTNVVKRRSQIILRFNFICCVTLGPSFADLDSSPSPVPLLFLPGSKAYTNYSKHIFFHLAVFIFHWLL